MSKRRIPWTLIVIVILLAIGYVAVHLSQGRRFPYEQIRIGMTESQLVELFRRPPDCLCRYRNARILYYSRGGLGDKWPENADVTVTDKTRIPWVYGCAQVLIGPDRTVHAFTWNGEDVKVRTISGDFQGSGLGKLDNSVLEGLCRDTAR